MGAQAIGDTGWSEARLADGSCYFFKATGETTWDVPPEVAAFRANSRPDKPGSEVPNGGSAPALGGQGPGSGGGIHGGAGGGVMAGPGGAVPGGPPVQAQHLGGAGRGGPPGMGGGGAGPGNGGHGPPYPPHHNPAGPGAFPPPGMSGGAPPPTSSGLPPYPPPPGMGAPPPQGMPMIPPGMMPPTHMMMAMMMGRMGQGGPMPGMMPVGHVPPASQPRAPMPPAPLKPTQEEEEEKRRQKEAEEKVEADKAELQRRKKEFKQLLLEKQVTPGGVWEKELPKFCFDKRCEQLLPLAKDRKDVFLTLSRSDLVKFNASKKERLAEKREKALGAVKQLLEEADLSASSTLSDFWAGVKDDERLVGLEEKDKKLVQLFNLRIEPLRAAHREAENVAREVFMELLQEDSTIDSSTSTCSRFLAQLEKAGKDAGVRVLSDKDKEQLFHEHMKALKAAAPAGSATSAGASSRKRGPDPGDGRDGREAREGGGSGDSSRYARERERIAGAGSDYRSTRDGGHDRYDFSVDHVRGSRPPTSPCLRSPLPPRPRPFLRCPFCPCSLSSVHVCCCTVFLRRISFLPSPPSALSSVSS